MSEASMIARVADAMINSRDWIQIHHHIDGRCVKSYAFKGDDDVFLFVVADDDGNIVELRPVTNLVAWAREQMEAHAFQSAEKRHEHGNA